MVCKIWNSEPFFQSLENSNMREETAALYRRYAFQKGTEVMHEPDWYDDDDDGVYGIEELFANEMRGVAEYCASGPLQMAVNQVLKCGNEMWLQEVYLGKLDLRHKLLLEMLRQRARARYLIGIRNAVRQMTREQKYALDSLAYHAYQAFSRQKPFSEVERNTVSNVQLHQMKCLADFAEGARSRGGWESEMLFPYGSYPSMDPAVSEALVELLTQSVAFTGSTDLLGGIHSLKDSLETWAV